MAHMGDFETHPIGTGERLKALEAALAPFAEAAKIGAQTYAAVKTANLHEAGLSSYRTVFISAGVHAAQSRVSYADWQRLAELPNA